MSVRQGYGSAQISGVGLIMLWACTGDTRDQLLWWATHPSLSSMPLLSLCVLGRYLYYNLAPLNLKWDLPMHCLPQG